MVRNQFWIRQKKWHLEISTSETPVSPPQAVEQHNSIFVVDVMLKERGCK